MEFQYNLTSSGAMLLKLACISLEIRLKLKSKFSRKKKLKLEGVNETHNLTYETTFQSFDDNIDPWTCCSDNKQDIRYSCVLEMRNHDVSQCCQDVDSHELHYACTDVTRINSAPTTNLDTKHPQACHQCQYWDLDSDLLLVESSG